MKNKIIFILSLVIIAQALLIFKFFKKERSGVSLPKAKITQKAKPMPYIVKVAIVLDDWGYNRNNLEILRLIEYPLTLAVLPNLAYSQEIAQEAHGLNKEIILHLPMEPQASEKLRLEQDTIMTQMPKDKILAILAQDLENLSYAVGVSNHMGSKLTLDEKAIKIIFEKLKEKRLFFLDSITSKSICKKVAENLGVRFVGRSVFLDNNLNEDYIAQQMRLLVKKAKIKGSAVGIGHDRKITLETLKKLMPELEKEEGVQFVFVSELAR
ncbi:MAG: divergent polysaccharide deacetylase family protein [Candidatus Omnitrophota bacterium]